MNKKNILAGCVALLSLGCATATALVGFERAKIAQPSELTRERGASHLTLRPGVTTKMRVSRPQSPSMLADENEILLSGFPKSQDEYKTISTFKPETSSNVTVSYNAKYTSKADGTKDTFPAIKIQMDYTKDVGDRRAEVWAFIPVDIEVANSKLGLSYEMVLNKKNVPVDFEILLTSAPEPDAVVSVADEQFDYKTDDINTAAHFETGFKGPETPGRYYLAIHHLGTKAGSGLQSQMWFFDINLFVTGTAGPIIGPNGELLYMHPTEDQFNSLTIVDGNNDGVVPTYYVVTSEISGELFDWPICYNNSNAKGDADEWLITPKVNLPDADVTYDVSIDAKVTGSFRTEAFDIYMGKEPTVEGMTKVVLDEPAVTANDYETYCSQFGIKEAGDYYFAIHIKSLKELGWRLAMKDFMVRKTDNSALIPEVAPEFTALADQRAGLKATATLTFPSLYMNGTVIPADTELTAKITSPVESKTLTGKPGEKGTVEIATEEGTNILFATVSSDKGEGPAAKAVVTCGLDAPKNPIVKAYPAADNMSVTLSWETPTIGQNGGIVDVESLEYNLYIFVETEDMAGWAPYKDGIKENHITLASPQEVQTYYDFMIEAVNEKGSSPGSMDSYISVVLGRPYNLPSGDPIANRQILSGFNIEYPNGDYGTVNIALDDPSVLGADAACEDACALITVPQEFTGGKAMFSTAKFCATGNSNIRALFNVFCYEGMASADIWVKGYNEEPVLLKTVTSADGTGWTPIPLDLPANFNNCPWIYFTLDVDCPTVASYFILESFEVYERRAKDLGMVTLMVPDNLILGKEAEFTATVMNRGYDQMSVPELKVRLGDNLLTAFESKVNPSDGVTTLEPDAKTVYTGKFMVNKADYAGKTLQFTVSLPDNDEDNGNNSKSMPVKVGVPSVPIITDLDGRQNADTEEVQLTWSDPYEHGFVENFESYPFGTYSTFIGPWKNMDFDRKIDFTFANTEFPGQGSPKAFQVLNDYEIGLGGMLDLPSGNQFLCSMSAEEGETDNWLISPEVIGGSNLTMMVAAISRAYVENFEIMYSETDADPDSFKTLEDFTLTESGWEEVSLKLPKEAKFFAIHYYGRDAFGIFVDDICYSPLNPEVKITAYNIYRDDTLVSESWTNLGFTDKSVKIGESHSYNVSVIGKVGDAEIEYPLSNTVRISLTSVNDLTSTTDIYGAKGAIVIKGYAGETADIYDSAARGVVSLDLTQEETVALPAGIYIVRIEGRTTKVAVR